MDKNIETSENPNALSEIGMVSGLSGAKIRPPRGGTKVTSKKVYERLNCMVLKGSYEFKQ